MRTPRTPELTAVINTYPTPDSIGYTPRKRRALEPPSSPSRSSRRNNATQATMAPPSTELKRVPRNGKTVGPIYLPLDNGARGEDEAASSTASKGESRKRKRAPGTKIKVDLTDKGSSSRTTKEGPELPVTPMGPPAPGIYPTPSSLNESPLGRKPSFSEPVLCSPKPPRWESDSPVELDNEDDDPSWDSPKTGKRSRSTSKVPDDELYLPSPNAGAFSKRELLMNGSDDDVVSDEDEYLDGRGVSRNETKDVVFDFSLERAKRLSTAVSLSENTWSKAERELFFRLAMRGFEPLLPRHWQLDFSTLPDTLFSVPEDEGKGPLVQALKTSDFHAIKSLAGLFSLGGHVRDCSILESSPEVKIKRAIKKYIRWALHDADLHAKPGAIPVHTIHAQKRGETIVSAVTRLNQRLISLSKRYHDALGVSSSGKRNTSSQGVFQNPIVEIKQEPNTDTSPNSLRKFPLLVGFVICGPIVAILTLDTDPLSPRNRGEGTTSSKFISQFDVGEPGQDVWTSLAVAITVIHIRQTMIELASDGEEGFYRFKEALRPYSDEDL